MRHAELIAETAKRTAEEACPAKEFVGEGDDWRELNETLKKRRQIEAAAFAFGNGLMALLEDADEQL